jgi:hypothetical protein
LARYQVVQISCQSSRLTFSKAQFNNMRASSFFFEDWACDLRDPVGKRGLALVDHSAITPLSPIRFLGLSVFSNKTRGKRVFFVKGPLAWSVGGELALGTNKE